MHNKLKPSVLGALPDQWARMRFKNICTVRQGLQIPISNRLKVPTESSKEYITIQSINKKNQEREYVDFPSERVVCNYDDILMTRTGNTGIVVTNVCGAFHNNFFLIDYKRDMADKDFLVEYLRTPRVQHVLLTKAGSSTIPDLNHKDFYSIELPVPPLPEQKKIAEILSTWDKAIETVERLIENSQQKKKALMQQLLTGKKRFPGFDEEWTEYRFYEVFERIKRKNTVGNENVLTISGQHGLVSQREYFNKSVASSNLSGYTLLHQGDFAYNKSYSKGYPYGAIKPLQQYESGVVSSLYLCFTLIDQQHHSHDYMRHFFEYGMFDREVYAIAQEGARNHGLLNVSVHDFFNAKLCIPSLEEQRAIATIIYSAEKEIDNLNCQLELIKNQKKALMQQLLIGKKRVVITQ